MKCIKTALGVAAVVGLIAGYVVRDTEEYLRSPFFGDKNEAIYSSRGHNFTSTTRVRLDKQPDRSTTTFLGTLHGAQSDLLASMSDRTLTDFQKLRISANFKIYEEFIMRALKQTNAPEDNIRDKEKRQERLPNDSFKAYPVFARR